MDNNIYFREIKRSDYKALEKIISDTWGYEKFCGPKTAIRMAKLYLASCLTDQTFTCVAINNNEPVGIIMGKDEHNHRTPLRYIMLQIYATVLLLLSEDGRKTAHLFKGFDQIDKDMLKQSGKNFDGQLTFFVVKSDQRGTGIGKQLFKYLCDYMQKNQLKDFYLFTDSKCNYEFYEHQGLVRIGENNFSLKPQHNDEIEMFLYEKTNVQIT